MTIKEQFVKQIDMPHFGQTPEQQLQKKQGAMVLLKRWLEEKITHEEAKARQQFLETVKKIVDEARPSGHKLYYPESE